MRATSVVLVLLSTFAAAAPSPEATAFQHARLIDGTGRALEDATLIVNGGRITAINAKIPEGATVVDATGKTIIPGLITAHGHLGIVQGTRSAPENYTRANVAAQLVQYARYGVTAVLSLGLNRDLVYELRNERRTDPATLPGAAIFTAGRGIGVPSGAPPLNLAPDQVYRPETPELARQAVVEMAAHNPDILKIWVDDIAGSMPKMKPEIYKAVIKEAHKNRLRVAAHVFYLADAKALVDAGVDVIAHSIRDRDVDAALIRKMKSKGVAYIPTLQLDESFFVYADHPEALQDPFLARGLNPALRAMLLSPEWRAKTEADPKVKNNRAAFDQAGRNLAALHKGGVRIALGTDSGATPLRIQGFAEHRELELMVASGLSPMEALLAATRDSAAILGVTDRGTLEAGRRADFVVLDANPLEDIRNTRKIAAVWINGRKLQP